MKSEIFIRLVFTVFLFNFFNAFSQTNIPSGYVSGLWPISGSPYLIQGSIIIPNDSTLTIEPGVIVNFQGTYKLYVQGRIIAIGTAVDTIIFTSTNTINGWRGIRFENTLTTNDTSKFVYIKLQFGKASGASPDDNGGAFYLNNYSKVIISNCHISNCTANYSGGGIYCNNSNPTISDNLISNNTAYSYYGGGIYCNYNSSTISNNIISNNIAYCGGGISIYNSSTNIINNTISFNRSNSSSGGINCSYSSPIIDNNKISNNSASIDGGGIACYVSGPAISNNIISNNTAISKSGGIHCYQSNPTISNNIISNNAANSGGGIYCYDNSSPNITNSTVVNNSAAANGGALYCSTNSKPTLRNTIIWGNTATTSGQQVYLYDENSDPNIYFCDVQGGTTVFELNGNFYTGIYQNNINSNPLFVSPSTGSGTVYNGITADWSLQSGSPCINTGDLSGTYPSTDIVGNPRVYGGIIDIGAYEYQGGLSIELISQDFFSVSPNPVYDNIEIIGLENGKIEIINAHGQIIKTINDLNKKTSVDFSKCATGLYLIKATFDNKIIVKTIIKQ